MASTSTTNAAAESRTTSVDDQRGLGFFFGKAALTLVTLGFEVADPSSPRRASVRAHASGRPSP